MQEYRCNTIPKIFKQQEDKKMKKKFKLHYVKNGMKQFICSFDSMTEAEKWKDFLAFTMKEFPFDELIIS